ncbi:sugar phosphate isomerase [Clostridia bacterium]|nr:sugar phosphate isomerase [Clostridia bacterium]
MEKRYLQLYSLGQSLREDFGGSLKKVREMGYTGVEFAGNFYGDYDAPALKSMLAELGLEPIGSHVKLDVIPEHLDYAAELGVKYLIVPMTSISTDAEAEEIAGELNRVGRLAAARGIQVGYHNHRHEFLPGKDGCLLETMLKNTDPAYVCFELDVGWATCSGVDCPSFIAKYAGRIPLIHVKECNYVSGPQAMPDFSSYPKDASGAPMIPPEVRAKLAEQRKWNTPSGKGIIDWPAVVKASLAQGAEGFIVEREYDYANDIFQCVKEDCEYLKTL